MKKILIIGHTFPEPTTTAAGTRMMQLIQVFLDNDYEITFASTASIAEKSFDLTTLGITIQLIRLNDVGFDDFIKNLNPHVVLFDRFLTEEQFGWRVAEQCPDTLRVLDTEDLHFLRKARQESFKKEGNLESVNLFSDTAKRELASIYRCDISLIISEFEMNLLQDTFQIPSSILYYLPFLINEPDSKFTPYEDRKHFITIVNLLHAPNLDSVLYLKKEIWPAIKKQLPQAELHIYGNYAPQQIQELHTKKEGFLIKGWVSDVKGVMSQSKVCLAPLRFGAGLKGKFIDAMISGTPSVTTPLGAEGIAGKNDFAGVIASSSSAIIKASIDLYTDEQLWNSSQEKGRSILKDKFLKEDHYQLFIEKSDSIINNLEKHRQQNFVGLILQTQKMKATKYMSMWIEEKNKHII